MKMIFNLENPYTPRFCRHNIPYGDSYDNGYESGKSKGYYEAKKEFDNMFDIPNQNNLSLKSRLCGYIEIDGHLYATCNRGGLTHLESCKCKKHVDSEI